MRVLIYFLKDLQKKALSIFHYSLNPDGILILGVSESIDPMKHLFQPINKKIKIFKKNENRKNQKNLISIAGSYVPTNYPVYPEEEEISFDKFNSTIFDLFKERLLHEFCPTSLLINKKGDILYISGQIGKFFEVTQGITKMNISKMLRKELIFPISDKIPVVFKKEKMIMCKNLTIKGRQNKFNVILDILNPQKKEEKFAIIVFQDVKQNKTKNFKPPTKNYRVLTKS